MKLPLEGGAITRVAQTGRTARIDLEDGAVRPSRAHGRRPRELGSGRSDRGVGAALGRHLDLESAAPGRFPPGVEERLEKFTSLVAVALANAEAREQLNASRARIVQAGDAERRRLERNLHDGAQQRLVTLALGLRLAESRLPDDPAGAAELLARASEELALSLEELRELARGIHPAILTDRGLTPALEALADARDAAGRGQRPAAGPAARGDRGCRVLRGLGVARERRQVRLGESSPGRRSLATTACSWSRSPTTASAAQTPARDRASEGWPTGWRHWEATYASRASPARARPCGPSSRCPRRASVRRRRRPRGARR